MRQLLLNFSLIKNRYSKINLKICKSNQLQAFGFLFLLHSSVNYLFEQKVMKINKTLAQDLEFLEMYQQRELHLKKVLIPLRARRTKHALFDR